MKTLLFSFLLAFSLVFQANCRSNESEKNLRQKAEQLTRDLLIVDTHIDLPNRLYKGYYDASELTDGHFDYVKSLKGGLNSAFMSIYVPASLETEGGSKERAELLISYVEKLAADHPEKFKVAKSTRDVTENFSKTLVTLPMGMENGSPVEGELKNVKYFYDRGIRYITLCHTKDNHICDSSGDETDKWNGLSPFGEEVVKEMNRLGIMVDVSHVSDSTFYDVMSITKVPVIASHSGCRALTPGYARNMSDEMIKRLAENRGVIQVYFGTTLLNNDVRKGYEARKTKREQYLKEYDHADTKSAVKKYNDENPIDRGSIQDVINHIDHIVKLVGIDYVGLGSDFDGVEIVPEEISDASQYPNLIYELLKRGYSEQDIKKICSENILRVWREAEKFAEESK